MSGWAGPMTTTWTVPQALAMGNVTNAYFTSNATTYEPGTASPFSYAYAGGEGTFSYSGPAGLVHFNIPYTYVFNLLAEQGPTAFASGDISIWIDFRSNNGDQLYLNYIAVQGAPYNVTAPGAFNFDLNLAATDSGSMTFGTFAHAQAFAPVPLPAAFWLLGSGLVGLVGIRRKRSH
jgi:hypothetical protein